MSEPVIQSSDTVVSDSVDNALGLPEVAGETTQVQPEAPAPAQAPAPVKDSDTAKQQEPVVDKPAATDGTQEPDLDLITKFKIAAGDIDEHSEQAKPKPVIVPPPVSLQSKPEVTARDYSGISEEHKPLFTKMGNEAFAFAKRVYAERIELQQKLKDAESKTIPQSYLQNPQAYILTPDFREASQNVKLADGITEHWRNQLKNIRDGNKWQGLAYDDKNNIVATEAQTGSPEAEAYIIEALTTSANQAQEYRRKAAAVKESFTQRVTESTAVLKSAEAKYFAGFDDEKHPAFGIKAKMLQEIPVAFRDHPVTSIAINSMAAAVLAINKMQSMEAELTKLRTQQADVSKAQPTVRAIGSGNSTGTVKPITMADFNNRMADDLTE